MMRQLCASVFLLSVMSWNFLSPPFLSPPLLAGEPAAQSTSPGKTFEELKVGNQRFIDGKTEHSLTDSLRRKDLASGQHPSAVILSCSDSRVPPELVFDKGLGELFSVRVAGNVLGAATVASIEDAVEHLGASLVVILGHESCGTIKAAITTKLGQSAGSPDMDSLLSSLRPALRGVSRDIASDDKTLRKPVMANVDAVGALLLQRSRIIRKHVEEGKLAVVYGIYGLESGKVDFWHAEALNPK